MGGSVKSAHFCYTVFNMNDLPIYDVLIIGAGASGLLCALECARARKRVLILEKDLVFYKVDEAEKSVIVYAVVDQRQEYLNILRGL